MNTTFQHEHYSESLKAACWLPLRFKMFQFSNLRTFKLSNSQTMLFCKLYNIAKIKTSQFEKCDNGIFPRSRPASHKHIQLSQGVYMTQSHIMGENHFREYFLRTFSLVPKGRWCALQCVIECRAKCKKTLAAKSKAKQRRYVHLGGQSPRRHYCLAMRLHAPNGEANLKTSYAHPQRTENRTLNTIPSFKNSFTLAPRSCSVSYKTAFRIQLTLNYGAAFHVVRDFHFGTPFHFWLDSYFRIWTWAQQGLD